MDSLAILVLVVAILITCFFAWLLLSTCLGPGLTRPFRALWDCALRAARADDGAGPHAMRMASARRRHELGFGESDVDLWEMERRTG